MNAQRKPVVMVVDDSKTILRTARLFLSDTCDVIPVADGFSALAAVQEVRPDVLFLDVMMPRLDGYHVCMAIRDNPEFKDMPIIMLSSKDSPFDKARAELLGSTGYMTKPFNRQDLLDAVVRHATIK